MTYGMFMPSPPAPHQAAAMAKGKGPYRGLGLRVHWQPHREPAAKPHMREDVVLGLRTITGSNPGTATSKLCVFGEVPCPLWAPISSRCLPQDLTGKY